MNYGRDYGNRNFLDRAANTVRGWFGNRGGHEYDNGYRPGMRGGWDDTRGGYREMGDVSGGYRSRQGGMEHGYGATNWTGRNADWNRGDLGGGWGRGAGEGYRTGGYQPQHGAWDVDWDGSDRTMPGSGMRGGMPLRNPSGMIGRYDRGYAQGRERYDSFRGNLEPGMRGGMMGRGMPGGMNRYDRDMGRGRSGGMGGYDTGMMGGGTDMGDVNGGTIGNYGAYGSYGLERFRGGNAGGVPTGQYWTGYGHGTGYNG